MQTNLKRTGLALGLLALSAWWGTQSLAQQITSLDFVPRLTIQSEVGTMNIIQYTNNLAPSNWAVLATVVVTQSPYTFLDLSAPPSPQRFYRVVDPNGPATNKPPTPAGMVWIPAGIFVMGSPTNEAARYSPEVQHTVMVSGFYMSRYLVTQGEYLSVLGSNPSYFTTQDYSGNPISPDLNRPVETVSWPDATNYCYRLNVREGRLGSGWVYRLPTESEWEYACRAGTTTPFHYGQNLLSGMANFNGEYEYIGGVGSSSNPNGIWLLRTTAVGSYPPNGFGLYDMHGNVLEWCLDWYGAYPTGSVVNPRGLESGESRVIRGGDWYDRARDCRSAYRWPAVPTERNYLIGFRPVLAPGQ